MDTTRDDLMTKIELYLLTPAMSTRYMSTDELLVHCGGVAIEDIDTMSPEDKQALVPEAQINWLTASRDVGYPFHGSL